MLRYGAGVLSILCCLGLLSGHSVQADNVISNGDFEQWPDENGLPTGWQGANINANTDLSRVAGFFGSTYAVQMNASGNGNIRREFHALLGGPYEIAFEFAHQTPAGGSDARSLHVQIRDSQTSGLSGLVMQIRVNGANTLQMYDGDNWHDVPGTEGAIVASDFDADELTIFRVTVFGNFDEIASGNETAPTIRLENLTSPEVIVPDAVGIYRNTPNRIDEFYLANNLVSALYRVDNVTATAETVDDPSLEISDEKGDGYRGIWFTLGQFSEYGDKYSGGLGTYTANHVPMAIYSPETNRTFFVYGGSREGQRRLVLFASYYDHDTGLVPRPTIVMDKGNVDDPHDNPSIAIDEDGYIWVFVSGRNVSRMGTTFRSVEPYSVDAFEWVFESVYTYPQPWWVEGEGFFFFFTQYTSGRELYFQTSLDGELWSTKQKFAGMGGHYQVSAQYGERIITAFMYHPGGTVDKRTNLYYAETSDMGQTWQRADGVPLALPMTDHQGPSLIRDYEAEGRLVYINDIQLDEDGHPVIFYVTTDHHQPGPGGGDRYQTIARWDGDAWLFSDVAPTTHNYDVGSIYLDDKVWRAFAPANPGPQEWGTGGEVGIWRSTDQGATWTEERKVTTGSDLNHSYVRRPVNAHDDFYAFWADGHADELSPSYKYFTSRDGKQVWQLPYDMADDYAYPEPIYPPTVNKMNLVAPGEGTGFQMRWRGHPSHSYTLERSTNLLAATPFHMLQSGITTTNHVVAVIDDTDTPGGPVFYRILKEEE